MSLFYSKFINFKKKRVVLLKEGDVGFKKPKYKIAAYKTLKEGEVKQDTLELVLGDTKYYVDLNENTALKAKNTEFADTKEMSDEAKAEYMLRKALGLSDTAEVPEKIGNSKYADQECELYLISVGPVCVWDGIPLYQEASLAGVTTAKTAAKVETNIDIPKDKFELPQGVVIKNE